MNKGTNFILGIIVLMIGVGMIFSNLSLFANELNDSDSISLDKIDKLVVIGSSEDIRIIKSDGSDLRAELTGQSNGFGFGKAKVDIRKFGDTVTVKVERSIFQKFSSSKLKLDIFISDNYKGDLSLNLSSGNLDMDERFDVNTLAIDLSSGNITLDEIHSEETIIDVSSGSLVINSFTGDIDGEISSGNIEIDFLEFDNDIKFDASSGSVEITLPKDSNFDFSASKSSGSIEIEFDLNDYSKSNHKIQGTVGSGGNEIDLDVSSGSILIDKK